MERPKYVIEKVISYKKGSSTQTEEVYVLRQHWFWMFYSEIHRSPNRDTIEVLRYHLTKQN